MVIVLGPVGPDLRPDLDLTWDLDLDLSLTINSILLLRRCVESNQIVKFETLGLSSLQKCIGEQTRQEQAPSVSQFQTILHVCFDIVMDHSVNVLTGDSFNVMFVTTADLQMTLHNGALK